MPYSVVGIWTLMMLPSTRTTRRLAREFNIEFLWLPRQWPEFNAMDQLWRELKRLIATNRQAQSIDALAANVARWVLRLMAQQARINAGMTSERFCLRRVLQDFWLPT